MKNQPFWKSSANPDNLSMVIKGLLWALLPLSLSFANSHGVEITQENAGEIIDAIQKAVVALSGAYAAMQIVWGLFRKLYNWSKG